jgi:hypothetical protein
MWVPCFSALKGLLEAEMDYQMTSPALLLQQVTAHFCYLMNANFMNEGGLPGSGVSVESEYFR